MDYAEATLPLDLAEAPKNAETGFAVLLKML